MADIFLWKHAFVDTCSIQRGIVVSGTGIKYLEICKSSKILMNEGLKFTKIFIS